MMSAKTMGLSVLLESTLVVKVVVYDNSVLPQAGDYFVIGK